MKLWSDSFADGAAIPPTNAFGKHDPESHVTLTDNKNPHLAWSDLPEGTKSLVLVCHDPDVPSKPDDVNQEGRTVPASLPRVNFHHWLLVDLPPEDGSIAEGGEMDGGPRAAPQNSLPLEHGVSQIRTGVLAGAIHHAPSCTCSHVGFSAFGFRGAGGDGRPAVGAGDRRVTLHRW